MRFLRRDGRERVLVTDITAMVDVVFLLIIFFLTTSSLVEVARERLELPREPGEEEKASPTPGIVVNIQTDGSIIVEGERVSREALLEMVAVEISRAGGNAAAIELLIRADRAASLQHLNDIAQGLTELGVRSWRLATRNPLPGERSD